MVRPGGPNHTRSPGDTPSVHDNLENVNMETQRPRIVSVTEIHYGFTTRYVVTYADGTQATYYHCMKDFLPFLSA